ncbi:N-acetylmuramoyl-L-alanine amidase [Oceanobacillus damuensis]|uniref:N-acetylmuramoyl-L-alanine amidase n=1 Tax=Oceanobacillus damuensis TaxID=937928 RepID=UPI00082A2542|nr:N-acetylmuramoyl-L-alanine amidase [Oceanobacillus damuensis]
MKYLKNLIVGISFLLLLAFAVPESTQANDGQAYEVTTNILNVRSEPASDAAILGYLSKGNKVVAFQEQYGWVQTYYGGKEAWVAKHYLWPASTGSNTSESTQTSDSGNSITVTASSVNVRSGPSTDHSIIGSTQSGDTYNLAETSGDWHKVNLANGSVGWIAAWLTDSAAPKVASASVDESSEDSSGGSSASQPAANGSLEGYTIVLDPGHGGKDPGAIAHGGVYEKDLVSSTATKAAKHLEDAGANVIVTRTGDHFVSLNDRIDISNAYNTHAFISLHYDSFPVLSVNGISTYYGDGSDRQLAQNIQSSLASSVNLNNRGIMQGNFRVLRNTTAPSVLIELGFLSNQNDLAVIQTEGYQNQVANAITNGLIHYFE